MGPRGEQGFTGPTGQAGLDGVLGYEVVYSALVTSTVVGDPASHSAMADATCPVGKIAISGGYTLLDAGGSSGLTGATVDLEQVVNSSRTWRVRSHGTSAHQLYASATCVIGTAPSQCGRTAGTKPQPQRCRTARQAR